MRTSTIDGHTVVGVNGEIDMATLPQLHNALVRAIHEHHGSVVIVDLDGVVACDDAGFGVLLGAAGRSRDAGGDLVAVCSDGPLANRLMRTGFDRAVIVVSTVRAAIDRLTTLR